MSSGRLVSRALPLAALALLAFVLLSCSGGDGDEEEGARFAHELAYLDAEGMLWIVDADGTDRRKLADVGECSSGIEWSPTGDRLVCEREGGLIVLRVAEGTAVGNIETTGLGRTPWSPSGEAFLYWTSVRSAEDTEYELFLADDSGELLVELGPWDPAGIWPGQAYRGFPLWSPDGSQFVYRSADTGEARIYSLDTGTEQMLEGDYHPLGWALDGAALLVAANYQPPQALRFPSYEVNLLDVSGGELRRLPELDDGVQFWISPDGSYVAALTRPNEGLHGPGLAVLDLRSGQFTPIPDSVISNPTDSIGKNQVRFSRDGGQIYWTDTGPPATIYSSSNDGTGLSKLAEYPGRQASLSPDMTMVTYNVFDDDTDTTTLYVSDINGTNTRQIDSQTSEGGVRHFQFAWRPNP